MPGPGFVLERIFLYRAEFTIEILESFSIGPRYLCSVEVIAVFLSSLPFANALLRRRFCKGSHIVLKK